MKYINRKNLRNGFTLIELLLYVAIISGLLLAIVGFYSLAIDARIKNQAVAEVNQQGTFAMDQILQVIRNGSSITLPLISTSGPGLTMVVLLPTLSPTLIGLNGTVLQTTEGSLLPVSLTSSRVQVSSLSFTNLTRLGTNGIIQVSFVVSSTNTSGRSQYDYQRTFTSSAEVGY